MINTAISKKWVYPPDENKITIYYDVLYEGVINPNGKVSISCLSYSWIFDINKDG